MRVRREPVLRCFRILRVGKIIMWRCMALLYNG